MRARSSRPGVVGERGFAAALRSVGIRTRLLGAFLAVSIVPIVAVGLYAGSSFARAMDAQVSAYSGQVVAELAKNLSGVLDRLLALSESVIVNARVQSALSGPDDVGLASRRELLRGLDVELSAQVYRFNKVHGITIFRRDGSLLFETGYETYRPEELAALRSSALDAPQNMYWTALSALRGGRSIVLSRMIYSAEDLNEAIGSLCLMVDEGLFAREAFSGLDLGEGAGVYVLSQAGTVVSSASDRGAVGLPFPDAGLFARVAEGASEGGYAAARSFAHRGREGRSLVCAAAVPPADWSVVAIIPSRAAERVSRQVLLGVVAVCAAALAAVSFLASAIFASLMRPLERLSGAAAALRLGDFSHRLDDPFPDEIGALSSAVDETARRLAALVEEIRVKEEEKRRVELEMLQSQIKPHFLFNALDSLKWTAMLRGDGLVGEGIAALSSLLRNAVLGGEDLVPLESELRCLEAYVLVMKLRYGEGFRFSADVAEGLGPCTLPKLSLQPFVENAIVHGAVEGRIVEVRLSAREEGGSLAVRVEDDGRGFDPAARGGPRPRGKGEERFSGIGIANVEERLRLHYGDAARVEVASAPGAGTRVLVILPIARPLLLPNEGRAGEGEPC